MCVLPIPRPNERAGEVPYSQTRNFFQNISMHLLFVIFIGYFDLITQVFDLGIVQINGNNNVRHIKFC